MRRRVVTRAAAALLALAAVAGCGDSASTGVGTAGEGDKASGAVVKSGDGKTMTRSRTPK